MPEFSKLGSYFKADLEIVFKQLLLKYDLQHNCIDLYGFFEAIETLTQKIYKPSEETTFGDNITTFLDVTTTYFEELIAQQEQEMELNKSKPEPSFAAKRKIPDRY